jgi:hypothetical protein
MACELPVMRTTGSRLVSYMPRRSRTGAEVNL